MHQSIVQPAVTNGFSIRPSTITSHPLANVAGNVYPTTTEFNPVSIVVPAMMPQSLVQAREVDVNHAATSSNYNLVYPNINFSSPNSGTTYNPTNSNSLSNGSGSSSSSGNQSYTVGNNSNYMLNMTQTAGTPNPNLLSPDYRPDLHNHSYAVATSQTTSPFSTALQQTPIRITSMDKQPHYLPVPYSQPTNVGQMTVPQPQPIG